MDTRSHAAVCVLVPAVAAAVEIDGNLQCTGNSPAPTGSGNVVGGNAEDQCAALAAP
jgi:hypothetical protein